MNRPEPLTPEERELARLLGRPGTSSPSARVDEAVLAAARAAVGTGAAAAAVEAAPGPTATRAPRRRTRLPAVLGVAASVVFAVGIAWQLKFDDPTTASAPPPAIEVATDTAAPTAEPAETPAEARAAAESTIEAPGVTEPVPARNAPPTPAHPPAPVKPIAPAAPVEAPAPAAEAFSADTYSAAPPPPAPAQGSAEKAAEPAAEERVALDAIQVTGSKIETPRERSALRAQRAAPAASARGEMPAPAAAMAAPADFGGQPDSAAITTAVDADALLPRRQWIERIRERRDAGDLETARASLRRYLQHYPEVRVPRDLRALLDS
ncbi:hypothetical protein [Stenotrophomonas oahuensis]|uniref:Proline/alanine-rich repetetive membrane anchored protein n=1 Tax=Stenotrophomonas oahuensis TaxID=3003271 RepID=A0ABY9YLF5_9GAMM|nr:hypothetical protein [Stenotrophomonas sp. A5586]WNH51715.1 hypothetical protein PDM29_15385 [Stenotrophomonas sp. A5586]